MVENLENRLIEGKEWLPLGIGLALNFKRLSQSRQEYRRLSIGEVSLLVGYTLYQVGSLITLPYTIKHFLQ